MLNSEMEWQRWVAYRPASTGAEAVFKQHKALIGQFRPFAIVGAWSFERRFTSNSGPSQSDGIRSVAAPSSLSALACMAEWLDAACDDFELRELRRLEETFALWR